MRILVSIILFKIYIFSSFCRSINSFKDIERSGQLCAYTWDFAACNHGQVKVLSETPNEILIGIKVMEKANAITIARHFLSQNRKNHNKLTLVGCENIFGGSINFQDIDADYSGKGYWYCQFSANLIP